MLPAFADTDDLADRLPGGIADVDATRAQAALDDASAIIRSVAGKNWVDDNDELEDVPDIIVTITCRAALRAFANPVGVTQETAGPFSASYANASSDVYLTVGERRDIKAAAGKDGLGVRSTTRGAIETGCLAYPPEGVADVYVDVEPAGQPLPFL